MRRQGSCAPTRKKSAQSKDKSSFWRTHFLMGTVALCRFCSTAKNFSARTTKKTKKNTRRSAPKNRPKDLGGNPHQLQYVSLCSSTAIQHLCTTFAAARQASNTHGNEILSRMRTFSFWPFYVKRTFWKVFFPIQFVSSRRLFQPARRLVDF